MTFERNRIDFAGTDAARHDLRLIPSGGAGHVKFCFLCCRAQLSQVTVVKFMILTLFCYGKRQGDGKFGGKHTIKNVACFALTVH